MPSVLLVEDHVVMGRVMARLLREWGNMSILAIVQTADAALEKLAASVSEAALAANPEDASLPDLVLVDVSLPDMSGIELVAELQRRYPDLPCLMVSGHNESHYVRQALDAGARGYVTKGDPPAIVEAVRRVLDGEIYLSDNVRGEFES